MTRYRLMCNDDDENLSAVRGAGAWAVRMLLATGSAEVRSEASALVRNIAADGERARLAVLSLLADALPDACDCANSAEAGAGDGAATCDEYFDTFASVMDGGDEDAAVSARGYLRSCGALDAVVREMAKESARLGHAEAAAFPTPDRPRPIIAQSSALGQSSDSGALAGRLAEVLARLVADVATPIDVTTAATKRLAKRLASTPGAIATATRCVLALRSLVGARTAEATTAERTLSALVLAAVEASAEAKRIAIAAAVAEARRTGPAPLDPPLGEPVVVGDDGERGDGETRGLEKEGSVVEVSSPPPAPAGHVLSWLARLILPDDSSEDASYSLRLVKSATQEEFIRGQMTKNPYDSAEHSLHSMRDVKNFVCVSLDMHGLCDDDFGMELLVAGKIVSLDLPVADVFEHVWRRPWNPPDGGDDGGGAAIWRTRSAQTPPRGRRRRRRRRPRLLRGERDPAALVLRRRPRPWWSRTGCRAWTGRRRRRWYPRLTARAPRLTRTRR